MRKLKIKRMDFEFAFELGTEETVAYLDTETGAVILVEDHAVDQLEELLTDEETLEDLLAAVQAQSDGDGRVE